MLRHNSLLFWGFCRRQGETQGLSLEGCKPQGKLTNAGNSPLYVSEKQCASMAATHWFGFCGV